MKKLPYIEDYILLMANDPFTWPPPHPLINLARYDVGIVSSMSEQINRQLGFTDRQSVLAHKIVTKYRKQWSVAGYDVEHHVETPKFRLPIRTVNRRRYVQVANGRIEIYFPYDQDIISRIRAGVQDIPGQLIWNPDSHCWSAALIEPRIIWAKEFAHANEFEIDSTFYQVVKEMLDQSDYEIRLTYKNGLTVENAESSLIDYVQENIGFDNLVGLVDASAILAVTVDQSIVDQLKQTYTETVVDLLLSREYTSTYTKDITNFGQVVEYARLTDRFPIYVYESGSNALHQEIKKHFRPDEIISSGFHLKTKEEIAQARVCYISHWKHAGHDMPLFVTLHGLTIGHRRQAVATRAQKIVYYTHIAENNDL